MNEEGYLFLTDELPPDHLRRCQHLPGRSRRRVVAGIAASLTWPRSECLMRSGARRSRQSCRLVEKGSRHRGAGVRADQLHSTRLAHFKCRVPSISWTGYRGKIRERSSSGNYRALSGGSRKQPFPNQPFPNQPVRRALTWHLRRTHRRHHRGGSWHRARDALEFASQGAKIVVNDLGAEVDGTGSSAGPAGEVVTRSGAWAGGGGRWRRRQ